MQISPLREDDRDGKITHWVNITLHSQADCDVLTQVVDRDYPIDNNTDENTLAKRWDGMVDSGLVSAEEDAAVDTETEVRLGANDAELDEAKARLLVDVQGAANFEAALGKAKRINDEAQEISIRLLGLQIVVFRQMLEGFLKSQGWYADPNAPKPVDPKHAEQPKPTEPLSPEKRQESELKKLLNTWLNKAKSVYEPTVRCGKRRQKIRERIYQKTRARSH